MKRSLIIIGLAFLASCATKKTTITYQPDRFGVPVPVVNGEQYPMTHAERKAIAQAFVNAYCPAQ